MGPEGVKPLYSPIFDLMCIYTCGYSCTCIMHGCIHMYLYPCAHPYTHTRMEHPPCVGGGTHTWGHVWMPTYTHGTCGWVGMHA